MLIRKSAFAAFCWFQLLPVALRADAPAAKDVFRPCAAGTVRLEGWVGHKLDLCLTNRVMSQNIEKVVQPFRVRQENGNWRCEYWGKWVTSVTLGHAYRPTPEYRAVIEKAAAQLMSTQTPDGYIGTCDARHELETWDIWGRKYVLLGLIACYDQTGDKLVLEAARREADHLMAQVGPGKVNIADTGLPLLKGLPTSSVLEPIALLYQRTGDKKYLNYANYIVGQWSVPSKFAPRGMRLIEDALAGVPPVQIDSPKAYEMMSCFEGLCELYRCTGERRYLDAAVKLGGSICKTERMVNGSGSNQEIWYDGVRVQTEVLEQPQETCVTATWMKLCYQLLRLTGDPKWADELELSLYNALAGAMAPQGQWWAYFSPLMGERVPSPVQHEDVGLSCCVVNGPRGLLLTPQWAIMNSEDGPVINLYAPGSAKLKLGDGGDVTLTQKTDYPVSDQVTITVDQAPGRPFALSLRIPSWSRRSVLTVNGQPATCEAGTYAKVSRPWAVGDTVVLKLDLRGRAVAAPSGAPQFAVMRGPILLAMDNRLTPPQDTDVRLVGDPEGYIDLKPCAAKPEEVWMAFDVPFEVRPSHFFGHRQIALAMCDFSSAGNGWSKENLFRVWLPQPLYMRDMYPSDTWQLMYTDKKTRPEMPAAPN